MSSPQTMKIIICLLFTFLCTIVHAQDGCTLTGAHAWGGEQHIKQGKNSSQLLGTITNNNDGWLFVAIPFENGWTASVDGENVEIIKADYGYSAIKLESGTHSVEFNYKTPYLRYSIAISLFGLLITLVWLVSSVKQIKKESKNKKIKL